MPQTADSIPESVASVDPQSDQSLRRSSRASPPTQGGLHRRVTQVRTFIEKLLETELEAAIGRGRPEEFKRRIQTQCLLPCAETTAMLLWALLASGQITLRRVAGSTAGRHSISHPPHLTPPPDPSHHALGPTPISTTTPTRPSRSSISS
jgi:hypothetical protein